MTSYPIFVVPELTTVEQRVLAEVRALYDVIRTRQAAAPPWLPTVRRLMAASAARGAVEISGSTVDFDAAIAATRLDALGDIAPAVRHSLTGHVMATSFATSMAGDPDYRYGAQLVKSLHFMLAGQEPGAGQWRTDTQRMRDPQSDAVLYEAAPADVVPALMARTLGDLNIDGGHNDALIRASVAHLNVLLAAPFAHNNGRIARAVHNLVLARELSPLAIEFVGIDEYLGARGADYHGIVRQTAGRRWDPSRDLGPWTRLMLTAHLHQALSVVDRLRDSERLWEVLHVLVAANGLSAKAHHALFDAAIGLGVPVAAGGRRGRRSGADAEEFKRLVAMGLVASRTSNGVSTFVATGKLHAIRSKVWPDTSSRRLPDPFEDEVIIQLPAAEVVAVEA